MILKGFIVVPDQDLVVVNEELPVHIELTREEQGCLVFEVTRDQSDRNRFHVYEEFASESAFEAHRLRVASSRWGRLTFGVERHYSVAGSTEEA